MREITLQRVLGPSWNKSHDASLRLVFDNNYVDVGPVEFRQHGTMIVRPPVGGLLSMPAVLGWDVARVTVPRFKDGERTGDPLGCGIGWLWGSDILVTCYHVVERHGVMEDPPDDNDIWHQAANLTAHFPGGDRLADGNEPIAWASTTEDLDIALIRLRPSSSHGSGFRGPLGSVDEVARGTVIHYRDGVRGDSGPVGLYPVEGLIYHVGDVEEGASGSPIFDEQWRLCGMHQESFDLSEDQDDLRAILWRHCSKKDSINRALPLAHVQTRLEAHYKE